MILHYLLFESGEYRLLPFLNAWECKLHCMPYFISLYVRYRYISTGENVFHYHHWLQWLPVGFTLCNISMSLILYLGNVLLLVDHLLNTCLDMKLSVELVEHFWDFKEWLESWIIVDYILGNLAYLCNASTTVLVLMKRSRCIKQLFANLGSETEGFELTITRWWMARNL